MPANPTTKSQVHAYQFVLRRMQSALVRKDSVMLHDPMRTHTRATIVGVVLSALGVLAFIVVGFFSPSPSLPDSGNIVIGEQSGAVYAVTGDPKKLVHAPNVASARLILMAQGKGGGSGSVGQPEVVPDDELIGVARGQPQGIPFGPPLLPSKNQRISPDWAVCDNIEWDSTLPDDVARQRSSAQTTVVAGIPEFGRELRNGEALLVEAPDTGKTYLVYRLEQNPNHPNADVVRAEVNLADRAVRFAYGLNMQPRKISREMLDAIPQENEIKAPEFSGAGQERLGLDVGEVFYVDRAAGGRQYHVVTQGGIQEVSKGVADLIRADRGGSVEERNPDQVAQVHKVTEDDPGYREVSTFPTGKPTILHPKQIPVSCLGWHLTGEKQNRQGHTTLYVGRSLPIPDGDQAVKVDRASPDGYQVDSFYLPPGRAAVVRSVTSMEQIGRGPIQLVSTQGIRYGVPKAATAKGLGLTPQDPAPELILRLLPTGSSLSVQNARQPWSPPQPQQAGNAAGSR